MGTIIGIIALARFLQYSNVKELDLSWNYIAEADLLKFLQNIKGQNVLQKLYLAGNNLTNEVGTIIEDMLFDSHSFEWICLEYGNLDKELLERINKHFIKEATPQIYSTVKSPIYEYVVAPVNSLSGGIYHKCYKMKELYWNKQNDEKILVELDVNDHRWSHKSHPVIQLFLGNLWRAVLGNNYAPEIKVVVSTNRVVGVASSLIEGFISILNDERLKACFPLCEGIQFNNLDEILSFSIFSGDYDIHLDNVGTNRGLQAYDTSVTLCKVDHDSLSFFSSKAQVSLNNMINKFTNGILFKRYFYDIYKPLFTEKYIFKSLINGFKKISQISGWESLIDTQLDLARIVQDYTEPSYILDSVLSSLKKHALHLKNLHKQLPEFINTLLVQKCIENGECREVTIDYNKKYDFIFWKGGINHPSTVCEYLHSSNSYNKLVNPISCVDYIREEL